MAACISDKFVACSVGKKWAHKMRPISAGEISWLPIQVANKKAKIVNKYIKIAFRFVFIINLYLHIVQDKLLLQFPLMLE